MALLKRFNDWSDSALRIFYGVIALISLAAIGMVFYGGVTYGSINSDDCLWEPSRVDSTYVVTSVIPGGNADRAGVKVGDRVIALNGIPVTGSNVLKAQQILNSAPTDVPIPYLVKRGEELIDLRVPLTRQFVYLPLVLSICAFLWLVIGLIVVLSRPRGEVQRRFFFAAAAMIFPFSSPQQFFAAAGFLVIPTLFWTVFGICFYPFWLRFCLAFPIRQTLFKNRPNGIGIYLPAIIGAILVVLVITLGEFGILNDNSPPLFYGVIALNTLEAFYVWAGIWMLYRGYRSMPAGADLRPMRAILIGTGMFFMVLLYLVVVQVSFKGVAFLYPQFLLPGLLLLALPISFGYAIFKYQVMNFRVVLRTTLVYTSMVVLLAGCYLGIGYAFSQLFGALIGEEAKATAEIIAFVLFVMALEPVKQRVQHAIEYRFFPQHRDYTQELTAYTAMISETVGTGAVAQVMADTLQRTLDLRGVVIVLEERMEGVFKPIARACEFEPVEVSEVSVEHLRQHFRSTHTNFILLDTVADPSLAEVREWFPYAAGLYAQGRLIGVALLSRPRGESRRGESLSGSQMPFITSATAQGAAAIEVARLYEDELQRQRYREELATARRIQESLLPSTMPDIPGIAIEAVSRPAQTVGGDYYDLIPLPDGRFLAVVADVSGKGLPASLYMAEFHGMVRVASSIHATPKAIFCVLNDHLCEVIARGSFITATMLLFDTRRRTVSFARAGHTPIIRRTATEVDNLVPSGLALGLRRGETFFNALQEYTVRYEPGETFILYSDGVSEAMNGKFEEFGEGRLLDIVSGTTVATAESLCRRTLERVEEFRGGAEQNDDITIVVIRILKDSREESIAPGSQPVSMVEMAPRG